MLVMLKVNSVFVTSAFSPVLDAASHATQSQRSAVTSQGDPLEERREVKRNCFHSSLGGASRSKSSSSSLPGLRREIVNFSQVLHR